MDELVAALRGLVQRGVLHRLDDAGGAQVVDVETAEGVVRGAAEVFQLPGLASNPDPAGVLALVLAAGGDQGAPLVLLSAPGYRLGNLQRGETAVYALDGGARLHCEPGGVVRLRAARKVVVEDAEEVEVTAATRITVTAPDVEMHANLKVVGTIQASGTITPNAP